MRLVNFDEPHDVEEATSTPLWRYVTRVGEKTKKEGRGTRTWTYNFNCIEASYTGLYACVRAHLLGEFQGQMSQGIAKCSKVSKEE
ncbi:hypothetical protein AMTR_s02491p00007000, partial [Amborella trichopoda]